MISGKNPKKRAQEGKKGFETTMTQGSGVQLRRWPRYKIDVRLKVSIGEGKDSSAAFGRGNNLSQSGMGAYIPCAIPVGAKVLLELKFPYSATEVKVKAMVRSCEGFRYGLEFVDVPADTRAVIEKNCDTAANMQ